MLCRCQVSLKQFQLFLSDFRLVLLELGLTSLFRLGPAASRGATSTWWSSFPVPAAVAMKRTTSSPDVLFRSAPHGRLAKASENGIPKVTEGASGFVTLMVSLARECYSVQMLLGSETKLTSSSEQFACSWMFYTKSASRCCREFQAHFSHPFVHEVEVPRWAVAGHSQCISPPSPVCTRASSRAP